MILAIDVHYYNNHATAAGVLFPSWESETATEELIVEIEQVAEYLPGRFYLRELPCILALLERVKYPLSCIIIDGFVWLGEERNRGLGMHLWDALEGRVPVIGVAKSRYAGTPHGTELVRGESRRPLFITAAGMTLDEAKMLIGRMKGRHRIPRLLKRVDQLCRSTRVVEPTGTIDTIIKR